MLCAVTVEDNGSDSKQSSGQATAAGCYAVQI